MAGVLRCPAVRTYLSVTLMTSSLIHPYEVYIIQTSLYKIKDYEFLSQHTVALPCTIMNKKRIKQSHALTRLLFYILLIYSQSERRTFCMDYVYEHISSLFC